MMSNEVLTRNFKALSHPRRAMIFRLLAKSPEAGDSLDQLPQATRLRYSSLVHHLREMGRCGLVRRHRRGPEVAHRLVPETSPPRSARRWISLRWPATARATPPGPPRRLGRTVPSTRTGATSSCGSAAAGPPSVRPGDRVLPVGRNLHRRHEREGALGETGMRQHRYRARPPAVPRAAGRAGLEGAAIRQHQAVDHQQIQIRRPAPQRSLRARRIPPDPVQRRQQRRRQLRRDYRGVDHVIAAAGRHEGVR